jgi:hypothetical protein
LVEKERAEILHLRERKIHCNPSKSVWGVYSKKLKSSDYEYSFLFFLVVVISFPS